MNVKPNRVVSMQRGGRSNSRVRRPFWLPASNFYILTIIVTVILFFVVWAVTRESDEENSIFIALVSAGTLLIGAVFLREIVLRNARQRILSAQKQLDYNISNISAQPAKTANNKISLEQNAAILKDIKKKSSAAKVLQNLPDTHREVFEICSQYLELSANQLKNVGVGSPRLAAFRRGRDVVKQLHRFHLLEWMQAETKILTQEAKIRVTISEKLNAAQKALDLIESALNFYPNEPQLTDSEIALKEFVSMIKVSHWIEEAERAAFKNEIQNAVGFYQDALFFLERGSIQIDEQEIIAEKIKKEIEKVQNLETKKR